MELSLEGLPPNAWVVITHAGLFKSEACLIENELIHMERPKFNRSIRRNKKLNGSKAKEYREAGMYYSEIANKLDVSAMTVWRFLNG